MLILLPTFLIGMANELTIDSAQLTMRVIENSQLRINNEWIARWVDIWQLTIENVPFKMV